MDSAGDDDYNQQLSEHRGEALRDYLAHEGMATGAVSANGFGKNRPVAMTPIRMIGSCALA